MKFPVLAIVISGLLSSQGLHPSTICIHLLFLSHPLLSPHSPLHTPLSHISIQNLKWKRVHFMLCISSREYIHESILKDITRVIVSLWNDID